MTKKQTPKPKTVATVKYDRCYIYVEGLQFAMTCFLCGAVVQNGVAHECRRPAK